MGWGSRRSRDRTQEPALSFSFPSSGLPSGPRPGKLRELDEGWELCLSPGAQPSLVSRLGAHKTFRQCCPACGKTKDGKKLLGAKSSLLLPNPAYSFFFLPRAPPICLHIYYPNGGLSRVEGARGKGQESHHHRFIMQSCLVCCVRDLPGVWAEFFIFWAPFPPSSHGLSGSHVNPFLLCFPGHRFQLSIL